MMVFDIGCCISDTAPRRLLHNNIQIIGHLLFKVCDCLFSALIAGSVFTNLAAPVIVNGLIVLG